MRILARLVLKGRCYESIDMMISITGPFLLKRRINMKTIAVPLLIALLLTSNGCMTYTSVKRARGEPYWSLNGSETPPSKPSPAYYALVPITVPLDLATCPFQGAWYGIDYLMLSGLGSTP